MERNDNGSSAFGFLTGLAIGALVGAAVAIVLAPQSGEETRDFLRNKAQEAKGKALDLASDLKDIAGNVAGDLRAQADQLTQKGRDLIDKARTRVSEAVDAGKNAAQAKIDEMQSEFGSPE